MESNKIKGCTLETNTGWDAPRQWKKEDSTRVFGTSVVDVETWIDTVANKTAYITYEYPPDDPAGGRVSVLLLHEYSKVDLGTSIDACIQEVEKVIMQSVNP